jgi:hypothetical protein
MFSSLPGGLLTRISPAVQQAAQMIWIKAELELLANYFGDSRGGPQVRGKSCCLSAAKEDLA